VRNVGCILHQKDIMKFSDLRLIEPLLRAVSGAGYNLATPIQAQAIPHVLSGRDVLGSAQTGTGKTAAFALPILQRLSSVTPYVPSIDSHPHGPKRVIRCLVLCPTRELATQIADSFRAYGKHLTLRHTVIFGGVNQNRQVDALRHGVDILIATPGRLIDLMEQRHVDLSGVEVLVLDEADRMLDMGFIPAIRRIVARIPVKRQTLLFSATMPNEIRQLASSMLHQPVAVQVAPPATTLKTIDESVYFVEKRNKPLLLAHLYQSLPMARTIVFTRTKHGADRVVRHLHTRGIRAEAIHGNKSQNQRERALANFRLCRTPVLVATDIASRGIDVDGVTHVVNYDLTHEPETYVHRIGRTARAGATGAAVSFCDQEERENLRAIESLIRRRIAVKNDHPQYPAAPTAQPSQAHAAKHDPRPSQRRGEAHAAQARREGHRQPRPMRAASQAEQPRRHHAKPARPAHPHARYPLFGGKHSRAGQGRRGPAQRRRGF
jgi:ATP-dependent RNA helicase RhlE